MSNADLFIRSWVFVSLNGAFFLLGAVRGQKVVAAINLLSVALNLSLLIRATVTP